MGKFNKLFWVNTKIFDLAGVALKLKRLPYYLKNYDVIKKNGELKNYKTSDTCYILGLGPSLKDVDLKKINGDVITVNTFYRMEDDNIIPKYYCIMDDVDYISDDSTLLRDATHRYPDSIFILNGKYKQQAEKRINKKVKRYYSFSWGGYFDEKMKIDMCKVMPIMGNIICMAIYMAMFIGYKRIVLLGCDFNSFTFRKEVHCYQEEEQKKAMSLGYELFCYSFCAETHMRLAKYAKKKGIKITNATKGSLIDAYPFSEREIKAYLKDYREG